MNSRNVFRLLSFCTIMTLMWAFIPSHAVYAASIVVTTEADETTTNGACSLSEAIRNANEKGRSFPDCAQGTGVDTITFAPGVAAITLTSILPAVKEELTINGGGTVTISGGGTVGILIVNNKAKLTLQNITLSTGRNAAGNGGAVLNGGTLIVQNSRFENNYALMGGAIYAAGVSTTIENSTFVGNTAASSGGGIVFAGGSNQLTNSLIQDSAANAGGGVVVQAGATVNISNVTLYHNQATHAAGQGGGGILVTGGTLTVTNATLAENSSANQGGGVRQTGGTVALQNTIVANSAGGNCAGTLSDGGGNLTWGDTTCPGSNLNPQLQPLADNGGAMQTMALGAGSGAVNLALYANCPATDQRGYNRRNGYCDSGAFEAQPAVLSAVSGAPQYAVIGYAFSDPLVAGVYDSYNNGLGGVTVAFSAPASGASATLSHSSQITTSNGTASVTATANTILGEYVVTATSAGLSPAYFALANVEVEVSSITRAGASPTNAANVDFNVTFNVPVNGVDVTDFTLATSGAISGAAISGLSGSGAVYTVAVNTGSGDGTLRLDLNDDDSITDALYNRPLGGPGAGNGSFTSGEVYTIDKTAPNTTILTGPSSLTNSPNAEFTFESDEAGSTFECSLDGAAFAPCASPATYTGLSDGDHIFAARAMDLAGNIGPASTPYPWTVDTIPPETSITASPANPTNSTSASFSFESSETGSAFQCSLDGAAFAPCASPLAYTNLLEGDHTFAVYAVDLAGNADPSPATYNWTVDLTAPETTLTSYPDNPTASASASFTFESNEPGGVFECNLDGADFAPCASPTEFTNLADGEHQFAVRATDPAGNTDLLPAAYTWLVDTTAPVVSLVSSPASPTTHAEFTFIVTDSGVGVGAVTCWLDSEAPANCAAGSFSATVAEGSHIFSIQAVDQVGNTQLLRYSWLVDLTPPTAQVTPLASFQTNLAFNVNWSGNDALTGVKAYDVQVQINGGDWNNWLTNTTLTQASYSGEDGKTYAFRVRGTDLVDNVGDWSSPSATTVDVTAPVAAMGALQQVSEATFTVSWSGSDATSGVASYDVQVQINGGGWNDWLTAATSLSADYTGIPGQTLEFRVRARDQAGNVGEWSQAVSTTIAIRIFIPIILR